MSKMKMIGLKHGEIPGILKCQSKKTGIYKKARKSFKSRVKKAYDLCHGASPGIFVPIIKSHVQTILSLTWIFDLVINPLTQLANDAILASVYLERELLLSRHIKWQT